MSLLVAPALPPLDPVACESMRTAASVAATTAAASVSEGEIRIRLQPRHGAAARDVRLRWRLYGSAGAPLLAVLGGISADRRVTGDAGAPGWWDSLCGAGRAIDPARQRILGIDWLGARDLGAPAVDTADQADALAALLDTLALPRLHALIGASYGAMVGLAFAARHPQRLQRLIAIAGAHRAHPQAAALRAVQRSVVRFGIARGEPEQAVALARQLAMIGYRSPRELARRFAAPATLLDGRVHVAAEGWLQAAGARFAQRFDAERFLSLSESIDLHAVDPAAVRVPTTLIGFSTDQLVPLSDLCALQRELGATCDLHVLDSDYGHDAFLKEAVALGALLRRCLASRGG